MNKGKTVVYNGRKYPNYTITTDGRIFNVTTGRELKHSYVGKRHDPAINLRENKKGITAKVALLVLETYTGKPAPLTDKHSALSWSVNHIDGNWKNNNLSNLEWLTVSDNVKAYWASKRV